MAVTTYKTLGQGLLSSTSEMNAYVTPPGANAIIGSITFVNTSATTASTLTIWQTPTAGTAAGAAYLMRPTLTLQPGESYVLHGPKTVGTGVTFKVQASVANVVNYLVEGAELTGSSTDAAWGNAGARVYHSVNQSIPNATYQPLAFDSEHADIDGCHDTVTNNSRITIQTPGVYFLSGAITFALNGTGERQIAIRLNGSTQIAKNGEVQASASYWCHLTIATAYWLNAGDYVELLGMQSSGAALDVLAQNSGGTPHLSAVRVGYQTNPNKGVKIGSIELASGATGNLAVTGVGFKPSLVEFSYVMDSDLAIHEGDGRMDAQGGQFAHAKTTYGAGNVSTARRYTTYCFARTTSANPPVLTNALSFVSMDADGFTVNREIATQTHTIEYTAYH